MWRTPIITVPGKDLFLDRCVYESSWGTIVAGLMLWAAACAAVLLTDVALFFGGCR